MRESADKPLRGEAAWRAQREAIAARNAAACAAGAKRRADREADAADEAARRARRDSLAARQTRLP